MHETRRVSLICMKRPSRRIRARALAQQVQENRRCLRDRSGVVDSQHVRPRNLEPGGASKPLRLGERIFATALGEPLGQDGMGGCHQHRHEPGWPGAVPGEMLARAADNDYEADPAPGVDFGADPILGAVGAPVESEKACLATCFEFGCRE